ncbi:heat-inducible transcriptional repressor HrcA [Mycoplasma nasistruthionis]|uniref:Heat-inducible transcription repressor HrcA n=1 Tax=Mycoplasma nasistruthionis TaxID=353852 RepID=A0A4Y6I6S4_9MOLU|nr:heat-inducible transcriptional repressor HrcA [Mycoplasma nasistruthionis]QCZ36653.1 heat-inducible transcriptional repressor HrcA [Mycoplasma nasistruthionis]QDF64947.1 heat-inducible transcriptional repressor HrcA [Mycoplasma nasistruthionis]
MKLDKSNLLSPKMEDALKFTVLAYMKNNKKAVSSAYILKNFGSTDGLNYSSAKLRYLMNDLEKENYLTKDNEVKTNGRIPTQKGLNYFAKFLANNVTNEYTLKLDEVFNKRNLEDQQTIDTAAQLISEMTGLTIVTTNYQTSHLLLKSVDLVVLDQSSATVILVMSNGEVFSKIIHPAQNLFDMNDIKVAVKIFREYLIDVKLINVVSKIQEIKPILEQKINNYQELIKSFLVNVFEDFDAIQKYRNKIYGKSNLILSSEIKRAELNNLLDIMENHSIWEMLQPQVEDSDDVKILVNETASYMSKKIQSNDKVTEISIVGSPTSNYSAMHVALKALDHILSKNNK